MNGHSLVQASSNNLVNKGSSQIPMSRESKISVFEFLPIQIKLKVEHILASRLLQLSNTYSNVNATFIPLKREDEITSLAFSNAKFVSEKCISFNYLLWVASLQDEVRRGVRSKICKKIKGLL